MLSIEYWETWPTCVDLRVTSFEGGSRWFYPSDVVFLSLFYNLWVKKKGNSATRVRNITFQDIKPVIMKSLVHIHKCVIQSPWELKIPQSFVKALGGYKEERS